MFCAMPGLQPIASMVTSAPSRARRESKAGMAMISFDFSSTASWPSTRWRSVAKAETRCSARRPAASSWLRREVLPSSATRPGGSRPALRGPGLETGGKQHRIDAVHDHPQPVMTGNAVVEFRHGTQEIEIYLAPIGDVLVIVTVGDRAADDEQNDLAQRIHDLPGLAGVLDGRKMIEQTAQARLRQNGEHGGLPNRKAPGITP